MNFQHDQVSVIAACLFQDGIEHVEGFFILTIGDWTICHEELGKIIWSGLCIFQLPFDKISEVEK
jgi:hypothetical protein